MRWLPLQLNFFWWLLQTLHRCIILMMTENLCAHHRLQDSFLVKSNKKVANGTLRTAYPAQSGLRTLSYTSNIHKMSNLFVPMLVIHLAHLSLSVRGFGIAKKTSFFNRIGVICATKSLTHRHLSNCSSGNEHSVLAHAHYNCILHVTLPITIFGFRWEIQFYSE